MTTIAKRGRKPKKPSVVDVASVLPTETHKQAAYRLAFRGPSIEDAVAKARTLDEAQPEQEARA